jgi:hypothetical protein
VFKRTWAVLHVHENYREKSARVIARSSHVGCPDAGGCAEWEPNEADVKCFKNLVCTPVGARVTLAWCGQFERLKVVYEKVCLADIAWENENPVPSKQTGGGGEIDGDKYAAMLERREVAKFQVRARESAVDYAHALTGTRARRALRLACQCPRRWR